MTDKSLEMLKWLLEDLETDEGVATRPEAAPAPRPARCGTPVLLVIISVCRLCSVTE